MMPVDPSGPVGALVAAAIGAALGWLLTTIAGGWLARYERELSDVAAVDDARATFPKWWMPIAGALVAVVLWGWEVRALGQMPLDESGHPLSVVPMRGMGRLLAHLLLVWLLAAATWIDFRYRVIPDWITVPGVLTGLVATWSVPSILLPVAAEVPRPFATPLLAADVLGWSGPLSRFVMESGWGERAPPAALAAALAMYFAWWFVGTAPGDLCAGIVGDPTDHDAEASPPADATSGIPTASGPPDLPRLALLVAGLVAIVAAWSGGGERFAALFTALVGVAVSGGIVWATRAGASFALGREAMGLGDATLMAMVGAWLGWQASVLAAFLGVLFGIVHGVAQIVRHRENELPFGPSLCAGTVAIVVGWRWAWLASSESFAQPGQLAMVVVSVVAGTALSLAVWSRLGPSSRRIALAALLALTLLLLALLLLLSGGAGA